MMRPRRERYEFRAAVRISAHGRTEMKRNFAIKFATFSALAMVAGTLYPPAAWTQGGAPRYEVDANWPKPLPDRWILGGLGGLCVDAQDHVLILNRQDILEGELNSGRLAPPMIEFDPAGNVVHSWGDPKLIDSRLHSCHFDKDGNVWIASAPSGMVQKYSHDGSKLLLTIGKKGVYDTSDGTEKGKLSILPLPPSTCRQASLSIATMAMFISPMVRTTPATRRSPYSTL